MYAMLVHACSILSDIYDFQSFAILHELDTLHPQLLNNLNLSCNLQQWNHGTILVLA